MPLIPLPIYKPIFFAGRFEPILLNKVEIQPGRVVLQLPLRGLITQIPFNPRGLLRCRSDSRSRIFKVSSRSCPFGYGQFLAKFGIFGQIGIWHFKSTLKSLQIITMSFKNKFSAIQSSVHFPNKQLLNWSFAKVDFKQNLNGKILIFHTVSSILVECFTYLGMTRFDALYE